MTFTVFRPLSPEYPTLDKAKVADFMVAESYEYRRHWYEIGDFKLVIPDDADGAAYIAKDMLILVADEFISDSLIISAVARENHRLIITGYDMKIMLTWRISMFPQSEVEAGTYGYDVAQGSTGHVLGHYIEYNMIDATDANRNIYGISLGSMGGGLEQDTFMSRLQPLNEIAETLCKNADVGYDIEMLAEQPYRYILSLKPGNDYTNGSKAMRKMVFADFLNNAGKITVEQSAADRRNVIWVVNGGDSEAVVTSIYKPGNTAGFMRRETLISANCDGADVEMYALKETKDADDKTNINVELSDVSQYGRDFQVGDKITVINGSEKHDQRVLQVTKSFSGDKKSISVLIGDIPPKKPLNKIAKNIATSKAAEKETALEEATSGGGEDTNGNIVGGANNTLQAGSRNNIVGGEFGDINAKNTIAVGSYLINKYSDSAVFGRYNKWEDAALMVGGGTSDSDRKNIMQLDRNGDLHIAGKLIFDGGTEKGKEYEVIGVNYVDAPISKSGTSANIYGAFKNISCIRIRGLFRYDYGSGSYAHYFNLTIPALGLEDIFRTGEYSNSVIIKGTALSDRITFSVENVPSFASNAAWSIDSITFAQLREVE